MKRLFRLAIISFMLFAGIAVGYAYDEVEVKDGGQIMGHV